jgi:DNA-binding response OmpR family regulator
MPPVGDSDGFVPVTAVGRDWPCRLARLRPRYRAETSNPASCDGRPDTSGWLVRAQVLSRDEARRVRVLVIEDDAEMAETIGVGLRRAQMAVDLAFDGTSGLERALGSDYDVIVLDRDVPGIHGDDICAELTRAGNRSRVIMLTAAATTEDLVDGFGLGADDYLPKPFDFPELVARIGALIRRSQPALPPVIRRGDLGLDLAKRQAHRGGRTLELTPKEFGVLELLLAAGGRVVSSEELLERVWDENADPFSQSVKVTISRLRAKLGDPPVIETVPQAGYRA